MSTNTNQDQEIDLGQLFGKIGNLFDTIISSIFKGILFVQKNIVLLLILVAVGGGLGYFMDINNKNFNHEVIVSPNFGSVDYLYNKVNLINSKIRQKDYSFLKSIGISKPENISKVSIKPIVDIYSFVNENKADAKNAQNSQNFELVKLLSEEGDINKVLKDTLTSRNYTDHRISISTDGITTNKKTIDPILAYLNDSSFHNEYQKSYIDNIHFKIEQNEIIIKQIDGLLNQFSSTASNQKNDKLVYYNENSQLNGVIEQKNSLINEIGVLKTQLISLDKIVLDKSRVVNIKNTKGLNNKMKLVLPFLLVLGFLFVTFFIRFYKNQAAKISK
jgi:hypothetical protein